MLAIVLSLAARTGCTQDKPVATPTYLEIHRTSNSYEVKFSSDLDLNTLFNPELDEKVVSQRLVCALEDDHDFSVKHSLSKYFRGDISVAPASNAAQAQKLVYTSQANFFESHDNDRSRKYISDESLRRLLISEATIPCKIVMTAYLKRPYYSATMTIPVQDILKALPVN